MNRSAFVLWWTMVQGEGRSATTVRSAGGGPTLESPWLWLRPLWRLLIDDDFGAVERGGDEDTGGDAVRYAGVLADDARRNPDRLRWIEVSDELLVRLRVPTGHDTDLASKWNHDPTTHA